MSSYSKLTVDNKSIVPTVVEHNFNRGFDQLTGLPSSGTRGSVTIEFDLEFETDADTFFASWYIGQMSKSVNIEVAVPSETQKFLTINLEDAQLVGYRLLQDLKMPDSAQNAYVQIIIASPRITIGQATFVMGC